MANRVSTFIKKKILGKNQNLFSLDEPYQVMANLLKNYKVSTILDAGASNGHISKRLLDKFPSADIYAFEPNPMYSPELEEYAKTQPRFHPQFLALSDTLGIEQLHITQSPGSTSLLTPAAELGDIDPYGGAVKDVRNVQTVTIDNWAEQKGIPSIELMKFDIQAGELKALRGATETLKKSTLAVYSEIWFNAVYEDGALYSQIDLFLREHGFVLYDIFKPRYNPDGLIMWANALFVRQTLVE